MLKLKKEYTPKIPEGLLFGEEAYIVYVPGRGTRVIKDIIGEMYTLSKKQEMKVLANIDGVSVVVDATMGDADSVVHRVLALWTQKRTQKRK